MRLFQDTLRAIIVAGSCLLPVILLASGGSFPSGTKIKIPNGYQKIEKIKAGDVIMGVKENGNVDQTKVLTTTKSKVPLVAIKTKAGVIEAPKDTAIAMAGGGYCLVSELKLGHEIFYLDGNKLKTTVVLSLKPVKAKTTEVHTLTVDRPNNFIANNIVVHDRD
ncbi:MAG: hypothetical protein SFY80_01685 [Verrucomicrobiota bacterium]|nr:hypothetical protein [Verrucomicrobiota bacterium]